ncbi:MAG: hypothetical protein ACRD0U_20390 [Acidimicrobiales bacterium]
MNRVEEILGPEHAETMMELLPPVGWAEVATKHDLDALRAATKSDLATMRAETGEDIQRDLGQFRRDVITWILAANGIQTAVVGVLLS